jgi:hypothetical protein
MGKQRNEMSDKNQGSDKWDNFNKTVAAGGTLITALTGLALAGRALGLW